MTRASSDALVDVLVVGAGAAGMMAAIEAGRRGRRVRVVDHADPAARRSFDQPERVKRMSDEFRRALRMAATDVAESDVVLHHLRVPELV